MCMCLYFFASKEVEEPVDGGVWRFYSNSLLINSAKDSKQKDMRNG